MILINDISYLKTFINCYIIAFMYQMVTLNISKQIELIIQYLLSYKIGEFLLYRQQIIKVRSNKLSNSEQN